MMPKMRQRLTIAAAIVVGAICWTFARPYLQAADGASGLTLTTARVGMFAAVLTVVIAGIPALALGMLVSVTGHPLAGVFAVTVSLAALAVGGGPIDGWMVGASIPSDYGSLMIETLVWQAGVVVMLVVIQRLRSPLRSRWPALAFSDHLGIDTQIRFPEAQALAAGAICAGFGGVISYFFMRSTDSGQVIGVLLLAFGIGGFAAHLILPQSNPVGILLGPAVIALGAYGYVLMNFHTREDVLAAWFNGDLPGLALALPIHYASAAVAGCAAGVGIAQGFEAAKAKPGNATPLDIVEDVLTD